MNHQPLFRKYMLIFVVLVSGTLLASGVLEILFSYQENQSALLTLQQEKAVSLYRRKPKPCAGLDRIPRVYGPEGSGGGGAPRIASK